MCRWFVYASAAEDCLLEDVLVTPKHSLAKMVSDHYLPGLTHSDPSRNEDDKQIAARNLGLNIDGLGLCWYNSVSSSFNRNVEGLRPAMYKSISPPLNDFNFRSLCANTSSKMLFAHIRASSGSAVTPVNNHPFVFGRHSFMHNGTVSNFVDIRRQLCGLLDRDSFANVQGSTDSEHMAALYMTILSKSKGREAWDTQFSCAKMLQALMNVVDTVIRLQKEVSGKTATPNSLNLAVTDGERLLCIRFRNHKTQQPPTLYWSKSAGQTLNRKYPDLADGGDNSLSTETSGGHGQHIIVASEPTTYKEDEWHLIDRNSSLSVEKDGAAVHAALPYKEDWDTVDESSSKLPSGYRGFGCSPS